MLKASEVNKVKNGILILGDPHLLDNNTRKRPNSIESTHDLLDKIYKYVEDHKGIKLVVLGGDVQDHQPVALTEPLYWIDFFHKLADLLRGRYDLKTEVAGIPNFDQGVVQGTYPPIFSIRGNHDFRSVPDAHMDYAEWKKMVSKSGGVGTTGYDLLEKSGAFVMTSGIKFKSSQDGVADTYLLLTNYSDHEVLAKFPKGSEGDYKVKVTHQNVFARGYELSFKQVSEQHGAEWFEATEVADGANLLINNHLHTPLKEVEISKGSEMLQIGSMGRPSLDSSSKRDFANVVVCDLDRNDWVKDQLKLYPYAKQFDLDYLKRAHELDTANAFADADFGLDKSIKQEDSITYFKSLKSEIDDPELFNVALDILKKVAKQD